MKLYRVTTHEVVFKTYTIRADNEDAAREAIEDTESEEERENLSVEPVTIGDCNSWEILDITEVEDSEHAAEERKDVK